MRIGTKSFGLSYKQVGLWFFRPLRFGSTPPLSRLCRLNVYYSVTQHSPLCTNCFRWDSWYLLSWSFMIFYDVHLYLLMQIIWSEAPWNIQDFYNCFWWEPLDISYDSFMYSYVCYADHMDWSALKYRRLQLFASLHWCKAWGDTFGGKVALWAGGRRQICH